MSPFKISQVVFSLTHNTQIKRDQRIIIWSKSIREKTGLDTNRQFDMRRDLEMISSKMHWSITVYSCPKRLSMVDYNELDEPKILHRIICTESFRDPNTNTVLTAPEISLVYVEHYEVFGLIHKLEHFLSRFSLSPTLSLSLSLSFFLSFFLSFSLSFFLSFFLFYISTFFKCKSQLQTSYRFKRKMSTLPKSV